MSTKTSPEVARLLEEFRAQDLGVDMVVVQGFKRITVAKFSNGNKSWELTQGGRDLLDPPEIEVVEAKAPAPKNIDVRATKPK
jgi:molybdopterin-guanine dinucleotide biosynthesis protein